MAKMMTLGAHDSRQSVDYAMGTFAWAAPEMLMGEGLTPAVDVYSLGVVLWEIVTTVCRRNTCALPTPRDRALQCGQHKWALAAR